jgi:hypothetical protein
MVNPSDLPPFLNPPDLNLPAEEAARPYQPEPEAAHSHVQQVKQQHEMRLMQIEGVVGVGIQQAELGSEVIVVYLQNASVQSMIPEQLEHVPVKTQVIGEITAY